MISEIIVAVGIGFLPQSEQIRPCHPKKDCALSVKISHSTTSFDVTIDLLDSNEKTGTLWHELFVSIRIITYSNS